MSEGEGEGEREGEREDGVELLISSRRLTSHTDTRSSSSHAGEMSVQCMCL